MVAGEKRVERNPDDWVEAGRKFKQALAEVMAANAQLLALWRRQTGR